MIELPGWDDFISVNGFCYSSSMGESPKLNIPLKTSVAPTKGIAPATFVRNSTATYIEDGLVKTAGIDVIRFQNGRYLCEPAATNKSLHSISFTDAIWPKSTSLINANVATAPDGTTTASKITEASAVGYPGILQPIYSFSSGTLITQSWFVKASERSICALSNYSGTSDDYAFYDLGTKECGILTNASGTVVCGMYELEDGWFRIWMKSITGTQARSRLLILRSRAIQSVTGDGVSGLYIWGVQNEKGIRPTSYIPTTSAPVNRVADALHYTVGDVITQGQGSLYCEFVGSAFTGATRIVFDLSDGTPSNRMNTFINSTGNVVFNVYASGSQYVSTTGVSILSTLNKLFVTYETNSVKFYVNGVLCYTDTVCVIPNNITKLNVGCSYSDGSALTSEIGNIKYFKEVLTETEAIKLTTL